MNSSSVEIFLIFGGALAVLAVVFLGGRWLIFEGGIEWFRNKLQRR